MMAARRDSLRTNRHLAPAVRLGAALCASVFLALGASVATQEGPDYIMGTVQSSQGTEAGVWVIAETDDLPTNFIKIVVTDDDGRFVLPELPDALYSVWVRGYGLVDSTPVTVRPGADLTLTATVARTPQEAARVYPANYWYSLLEVPPRSEFPGTGPEGNGISPNMKSQEQWLDATKQGCQLCHQLGNQVSREITHLSHLGLDYSGNGPMRGSRRRTVGITVPGASVMARAGSIRSRAPLSSSVRT